MGPVLDKLTTYIDPDAQILALDLFIYILNDLNHDQALHYIQLLSDTFKKHPNIQCRSKYYRLLMKLYLSESGEFKKEESLRIALLHGFNDSSDNIRKEMIQFWHNDGKNLSSKVVKRMQQIFKIIYSPEVESSWVQSASELLLCLTSHSPDYDIVLFDALSEDTQLFEYQIDHAWSNRSLPMTPLFSTQSQMDMDIEFPGSSASSSNVDPAIFPASSTISQTSPTRKPQSKIHFTPTVSTNQTNQMDIDMMDSQDHDNPTHSQGNEDLYDSEGFRIPSTHFAVSFASHHAGDYLKSSISTGQGSSPIRIPKRFIKSSNVHPSQTTNVFAKRAMLKSANKEKYLKAARERRQNQIEIIRTYRRGDHCPPDVQIKSKEIILPFQALIRKDEILAQQILPTLFQSIMESVTDETERKQFIAIFQILIEQIFKQTRGTTSVTASLLQICYEEKSIQINPKLIFSSSLSSYNYHRGILLLEKQILHKERISNSSNASSTTSSTSTRSRRSTKSKSKASDMDIESERFVESDKLDDEWMQLLKLYKALQDDDVLLGLYDRLCSTSETKSALEAELRGDFKSALLTYEKALDRLDNEDSQLFASGDKEAIEFESSIWEQSRLECMNKLLMWDTLAENTAKELDDQIDNVWLDEYRVPFLRYFIDSHIKKRDRLDDLAVFIESSMNNANHRRILESEFLPEMSLLQICCNEFDKARTYTDSYYSYFLNQWSSIHPLAFIAKKSLLKNIQSVVEMNDFIYFTSTINNFQSSQKLYDFLKKWENSYPSSNYSDITSWDTIISNRNRMLEKFFEKYSNENHLSSSSSSSSVDLTEMKNHLVKERGNYYLQIASAARRQNNISVAESNLRLSYKSKSTFSFDFFISVVKLSIIKAKQSKSFDKYMKAYEYLEEKRSEPSISNHIGNAQRFCMVQAKIFHELASLVYEKPSIAHDTRLISFKSSSSPSSQLYSKAFRTYEKACKIINDHNQQLHEHFNISYVSKSYMEFALFCDFMLQKLVQSTSSSSSQNENLQISGDKYAHIVVENILKAMTLGSTKARDRFPRLLDLLGSFDSIHSIFNEYIKEIPSWMFIRWISQMLGILNESKAIANSVYPILNRISEEYPNALYYPFKISSETFNNYSLKLCSNITKKLNHPLIEEFIQALGKMTHPEHRFKDFAEALKPLMKNKSSNKEEILKIFHDMSEDIFNPSASFIGGYNKHFASTWKKPFLTKFGSDGSKLLKMDLKSFLSVVSDFIKRMNEKMEPSGTSPMKLSKFSTWLVDFDQSNHPPNQFIEKPGQYSGNCIPHVDSHIKINSFDSDTLVMGSLRKPKRLKIRGNDQKDYPYLVKGGEDLRLDQRVQQLFSVMNEIFYQDNQCTKRNLSLLTYQVVPMTSQVGLIEWIDNTKPLKALIEDEINKLSSASKLSIQSIPAAKKRDQWLRSFSKSGALCDMYFAMYEKADRKNCMKHVKQESDTIPWDLLRRAVFSLCATPEAYITIRSHFTHSLAAFSTLR